LFSAVNKNGRKWKAKSAFWSDQNDTWNEQIAGTTEDSLVVRTWAKWRLTKEQIAGTTMIYLYAHV
jgi:hypothetical protein